MLINRVSFPFSTPPLSRTRSSRWAASSDCSLSRAASSPPARFATPRTNCDTRHSRPPRPRHSLTRESRESAACRGNGTIPTAGSAAAATAGARQATTAEAAMTTASIYSTMTNAETRSQILSRFNFHARCAGQTPTRSDTGQAFAPGTCGGGCECGTRIDPDEDIDEPL